MSKTCIISKIHEVEQKKIKKYTPILLGVSDGKL